MTIYSVLKSLNPTSENRHSSRLNFTSAAWSDKCNEIYVILHYDKCNEIYVILHSLMGTAADAGTCLHQTLPASTDCLYGCMKIYHKTACTSLPEDEYLDVWNMSKTIFIHSSVFSLEGRAWQEPEPGHVTIMALAHCILGKFLGVVCHCFPPPPLDVPTLAARCLRLQRRERS